MITLGHMSLALYPLEKRVQIENETGWPCYANFGCRVNNSCNNPWQWAGKDTFFLLFNLGHSGVEELSQEPQDLNGGSESPPPPHCPSGSFRTSILAPSCRGDIFPKDPVCSPFFPLFFLITGGGAYGQGGTAMSEDCVGFARKQWSLHRIQLSQEVCCSEVAWQRCDSVSERQGLSCFHMTL